MNWYAAKKEHLGYIHMHVESKNSSSFFKKDVNVDGNLKWTVQISRAYKMTDNNPMK